MFIVPSALCLDRVVQLVELKTTSRVRPPVALSNKSSLPPEVLLHSSLDYLFISQDGHALMEMGVKTRVKQSPSSRLLDFKPTTV